MGGRIQGELASRPVYRENKKPLPHTERSGNPTLIQEDQTTTAIYRGEIFLTPTRIEGEVSSMGGRIQGGRNERRHV